LFYSAFLYLFSQRSPKRANLKHKVAGLHSSVLLVLLIGTMRGDILRIRIFCASFLFVHYQPLFSTPFFLFGDLEPNLLSSNIPPRRSY